MSILVAPKAVSAYQCHVHNNTDRCTVWDRIKSLVKEMQQQRFEEAAKKRPMIEWPGGPGTDAENSPTKEGEIKNEFKERCTVFDEREVIAHSWKLVRWNPYVLTERDKFIARWKPSENDERLKGGCGAMILPPENGHFTPLLRDVLHLTHHKTTPVTVSDASEDDMKKGGILHRMLFEEPRQLFNEKCQCTENRTFVSIFK
jgi:hypothetical protein